MWQFLRTGGGEPTRELFGRQPEVKQGQMGMGCGNRTLARKPVKYFYQPTKHSLGRFSLAVGCFFFVVPMMVGGVAFGQRADRMFLLGRQHANFAHSIGDGVTVSYLTLTWEQSRFESGVSLGLTRGITAFRSLSCCLWVAVARCK